MKRRTGDLLLFVADKKKVVADALGALRQKLGKELNLIDPSLFNFLWVTDWPLLEYDEEEGRYYAAHHPFTMPFREDLEYLDSDPSKVRAQAYDIVLNGYELRRRITYGFLNVIFKKKCSAVLGLHLKKQRNNLVSC